MRRETAATLALITLAAALQSFPVSAFAQQTAAELEEQIVRRAQWHIEHDEPEFALRLLEGLLDENDDVWTAQFLRGMALGQLGEEKTALEAFLAADDLNPGVADVYVWAGIASFGIGDYETCWEQTILAHQAGRNMSLEIDQLKEVAEAPRDLAQRLNAPRAFLADMDTSVRDHDTSLDTALMLGQGELLIVQQQLGRAVRDSRAFGLVRVRELAHYVIVLSISDYGNAAYAGAETKPGDLPTEVVDPDMMSPYANPLTHLTGTEEPLTHALEGMLELVNTNSGAVAFSVPLNIEDVTSVGDLSRELRRYVGYLERWARENG